jgi:site-specific recombinase XerD
MLRNSRKSRLPPGFPPPQPPTVWPVENRELLARYLTWLIEDGAGESCIQLYYLPMAGHVLGFNLKPYQQLDLEADLEKAMTYVEAKRPSASWEHLCRLGLNRFRRFLRQERGFLERDFPEANISRYQAGLPDWLVTQLEQYYHLRQVNWRPSRLKELSLSFWSNHTRLFRWLFARYPIQQLTDIKRVHVFAYMDERLAASRNPKTVNQDVRAFVACLHFLQTRDFPVHKALLTLPGLKEPDALPRFLTDEQVGQLQREMEGRVIAAQTLVQRRDALLDRAAFYLLWQGGLRLGEVEELSLNDLNLGQRQLVVRRGKGVKDRTVYLTDSAVSALQAWLEVRGQKQADHVFLFRHRPLCKDFLRGRIKATGERARVKVTPHQLRHTYATQLVNAGCRITSIQALLGHKHLNTTMTYARVYDCTVAEDYFQAMATIEKRLAGERKRPVEAAIITNGANGRENGRSSGSLLTLLDVLQSERLTDHQQALLAQLRHGLLTLGT